MSRKKIEVVELNKKKEEIILEEETSALILFWRHYRGLIFSILAILALIVFGVSAFLFAKNILRSEEPNIQEVSIDVSLSDYEANVSSNKAMDNDSAKDSFLKKKQFKTEGEVLLVKRIEHEVYTINYYSDGTAVKIMKKGNAVTRIAPLNNGEYGISEDGIINSAATVSETSVVSTKNYAWGKVTYFADGSAEVSNSKYDVFVRNKKDINDNYISENKLAYLKETKNIGDNKLNYYYDGTVEVITKGKSYIVRSVSDLNITGNTVSFKNNNQAEVYASKKMSDGITVDYYTDGGAIIKNGNKTISVRKSNSIVIKDNKVYEIVDSIYVEVSKKTADATYYTNGGAVVKYNGTTYYVPENSDIKYQDNKVSSIGSNVEKLTDENHVDDQDILIFEKTGVVTTSEYIAILPKEKIMYDASGKVKKPEEIGDDTSSFVIKNNTNEDLSYRVVLEESPRTTLKTEYIRYQLLANDDYVGPKQLSKEKWKTDYVAEGLKITGTNYILISDTIEAHSAKNISLMLWTDYDTIPNAMQNKYFYGTIKVYAWLEK